MGDPDHPLTKGVSADKCKSEEAEIFAHDWMRSIH